MRHRSPVEPSLRPRHELDQVVANIELTLISIVQGVALYFLADGARPILVEGRVAELPYVASGLLIILTVWTRSVLHAVTVIRWPIQFGHSFLYIIITLFEATLFSQVGSPRSWYPLSVATALVFWLGFVLERGLYEARRADSAGPVGRLLIDDLERDHRLSLRVLMPLMTAGWGLCWWLTWRYPAVFLEQGWHAALGAAQALALLGYLLSVLRFCRSIGARVVVMRGEIDGA